MHNRVLHFTDDRFFGRIPEDRRKKLDRLGDQGDGNFCAKGLWYEKEDFAEGKILLKKLCC